MSTESSDQKLMHALRLRAARRHEDAAAMLREAIGDDPRSAQAFFQLAITQLILDERPKTVLETIDEAIAVEPEDSDFHALRAELLSDLRQHPEAHAAAAEAQRLDPDNPSAHIAQGKAFMGERRWADAEKFFGKTLELDADNEAAGNLLAHVQRMQNRMDANASTVEQLLSENPESPHAHFNAGWAALQKGDHRTANFHFREALRLDPSFEGARAGLLESFKARNPLYRAYLSYCAFMQKFTGAAQWLIVIGIFVGYRLIKGALSTVSPLAGSIVVIVYLLFVFWIWLASGIGNGMILLDRHAKHALRRGERWEGICVGGGIAIGLVLILIGVLIPIYPLAFSGGFLAISTLPASLTFTNESRSGRKVFGAIFALNIFGAVVAGFAAIVSPAQTPDVVLSMFSVGALLVVLCTWIGGIESLREER